MLTQKITSNSRKVTKNVTEKRCILHSKNFSGESEILPISEFYGEGKSSYCKRCMKIHHRERRIRLQSETQKVNSVWKRFHDNLERTAREIIENDLDSETIQEVAIDEMMILVEEFKKLNEEWNSEESSEE